MNKTQVKSIIDHFADGEKEVYIGNVFEEMAIKAGVDYDYEIEKEKIFKLINKWAQCVKRPRKSYRTAFPISLNEMVNCGFETKKTRKLKRKVDYKFVQFYEQLADKNVRALFEFLNTLK